MLWATSQTFKTNGVDMEVKVKAARGVGKK